MKQEGSAGRPPALPAGGGNVGSAGGSGGEGGAASRSGVDWQAMLREAIEEERGDGEGGQIVQHVELDDDITEEGWLPK